MLFHDWAATATPASPRQAIVETFCDLLRVEQIRLRLVPFHLQASDLRFVANHQLLLVLALVSRADLARLSLQLL